MIVTQPSSRARAYLRDIGIDWITLTTKDQARYTEWKEAFRSVATEEQQKGHKWGEARFFGYQGESCGHIFLGKRNDGALLRISSSLAEERAYLFSPDGCHCTRIDIQVTCDYETPAPHLLERLYDQATGQKQGVGRPTAFTLIKNSNGARTLYVGARSSARYGRIYDKGMEQQSATPGVLIRYELEIKDDLADQAVAILFGSTTPDRAILALLGDFFSQRNIPVPWSQVVIPEGLRLPRIPVEDAGTLRWIEGPVGKAVARLMGTVGPERTTRAIFGSLLDNNSDSDMLDLIVQSVVQVYVEWQKGYSPKEGDTSWTQLHSQAGRSTN